MYARALARSTRLAGAVHYGVRRPSILAPSELSAVVARAARRWRGAARARSRLRQARTLHLWADRSRRPNRGRRRPGGASSSGAPASAATSSSPGARRRRAQSTSTSPSTRWSGARISIGSRAAPTSSRCSSCTISCRSTIPSSGPTAMRRLVRAPPRHDVFAGARPRHVERDGRPAAERGDPPARARRPGAICKAAAVAIADERRGGGGRGGRRARRGALFRHARHDRAAQEPSRPAQSLAGDGRGGRAGAEARHRRRTRLAQRRDLRDARPLARAQGPRRRGLRPRRRGAAHAARQRTRAACALLRRGLRTADRRGAGAWRSRDRLGPADLSRGVAGMRDADRDDRRSGLGPGRARARRRRLGARARGAAARARAIRVSTRASYFEALEAFLQGL